MTTKHLRSLANSALIICWAAQSLSASGASTIVNQWEGMAQVANSTIRPPDPHGAAGPSGIVATVNGRIAYYDKSGTPIWGPIGLLAFWSTVGATTGRDPRVIFDTDTRRFYVIMHENLSSAGYIDLAVSKNAHPTTSGTNDWYFYRPDITERVNGSGYGGDFEGIGSDGQAVYITQNMYLLPGPSVRPFLNCQILIFDNNNINNGIGTFTRVFTPNGDNFGFTLQPASVRGTNNPGNIAYFVETPVSTTTAVRIWTLVDPLGSPTLSSALIGVPDNGGAPATFAPQADSTLTIDTQSPFTQGNAFWHEDTLWFSHTAGGSFGKGSVFYYKINVHGFPSGTPTLGEAGSIDGGPGVWTYMPSIGGNAAGDVCLIYSQSSTSTYPAIMYTARAATDSAFETPVLLKPSPSYNYSDRWGDNATVSPDPVDGTLWISHEWVRSSAAHDWSTWWAQISLGNRTPSNDSFSNAVVLNGASGSVAGHNVYASKESGEPAHASFPGGSSVWWQWAPTQSGQVTFDTTGSAFDTLLAVYTGSSVSNLTTVAANNDFNNQFSSVTFPVSAGTTYYIAVDGMDGASGVIALNWGNNLPPLVTLTNPVNNATFTAPANLTLDADATDSDGSVTQVTFYAGTSLLGTLTNAPFSLAWSSVPAGNYSLTAVATDDAGASSTSAPVNISVSTPSTFAYVNVEAESGSLVSPMAIYPDLQASQGYYIASPTVIQGSASFTINLPHSGQFVIWCRVLAGSSSRDSFYVAVDGGTQDVYDVAQNAWSPDWQWNPVNGRNGSNPLTLDPLIFTLSAGSHTILFRAREANTLLDRFILTDDMAFVPVDAPNAAPLVQLTTPTNNASFTAPATVALRASASDSDGSVLQVSFYEGARLLGTRTNAPFSITWSNVQAGSYSLTAQAVDNLGALGVSSPANISVAPPSLTLEDTQLTGGNGNALIDFNECNDLSLLLRNNGSNTITGITASLSSTNSDVSILNGPVAYPDLPPGATAFNLTAFQVQTAPSFVGGSFLDLTLMLSTTSHGTQILPVRLVTSSTGQSFVYSSIDVPQAIVDLSAIDSNLKVSGLTAPVSTLTVSLYITHTYDGDLDISLIGPDGTTIDLTSDNGLNGDNFGTSSATPTTFDDAAASSITTGTSPFLGSFRPEQPLAAFLGKTGSAANGTWRLHVADDSANDTGLLNSWSIQFQTLPATDGGGPCNGSGNLPPLVTLTNPVNNATFTAPANLTLDADAADSDGSVTQVTFYAGTSLLGTLTNAPFSLAWSSVPAGNYSLTAVATDDAGASSTSASVNISVISPVNLPPLVTLTNPVNNATFTAPANLTLDADATDSDGSVTQVTFYAGTSLLGTLTNAPFSLAWSSVPAGNYSLTAVATDDAGASSTSAPVNILVSTPSTFAYVNVEAESGSLVSPMAIYPDLQASQGYYIASPTVIQGSASFTINLPHSGQFVIWCRVLAGSSSRDSFYVAVDGGTQDVYDVAQNAWSPDWQWNPVNGRNGSNPLTLDPLIFTLSAGSHTILFRAREANTLLDRFILTDDMAFVPVDAPNAAPLVQLTTPTNNASFTAPATVALSASASDSDGSVLQVSFYEGARLLGTRTNAPFSITWSNVQAGSYSLTAQAVDNLGALGVSSPANISVAPPSLTLEDTQLSGGNGNALIDFNECNDLSLLLRNNGSNTITGITASLSSTNSDVSILNGPVAYPDLPPGATAFNLTAFQVQTAPSFVGGSFLDLTLMLSTTSHGTQILPVRLVTSSTGQSFVYSSIDVPQAIVDLSAIDSNLKVSGLTAPISTLTVSLYITHTYDGDLDISLIGPDGTTIDLTSDNGLNGDNFGTSSATPTTFDDAAASSITTGTSPFLGSFRPEQPLAAFLGKTGSAANGTWRLHVADDSANDTGLLNSWSIQFQTLPATDGGGPCNGSGNLPPLVTLTNPVNNATFTAPANLTLDADAADSDGSVTQVTFYAGTSLLGTLTNAPFSLAWSSVPAGNYSLTAVATDDAGASSTSASVNISVTSPVNLPPLVTLTNPVNNATFTAPANLTLDADATDSDGSVTQVTFYAGTSLLGTLTNAPFSLAWSSVPAGNYSLTAVATDDAGASSTSASVNISVTSPVNLPPLVTLTNPVNNATFTAPANLTLDADAADSDGSVTQVTFYAGTSLLGTLTNAPFSLPRPVSLPAYLLPDRRRRR